MAVVEVKAVTKGAVAGHPVVMVFQSLPVSFMVATVCPRHADETCMSALTGGHAMT